MESKLVILKLMLDELDVELDVSTVNSRKYIQKAIYLGQLSGVDLGYRYGWYKLGPYCSTLTDDYYELARCMHAGEQDFSERKLPAALAQKLNPIKHALNPPPEILLSREDWLELLASTHYLRRVRRKDEDETREIMHREKEHLRPYIDSAEVVLKEIQVL